MFPILEIFQQAPKTLEPANKDTLPIAFKLAHPNLKDTLLIRMYYWKDSTEWYSKVIISPNNYYKDSVSIEYCYIFENSDYYPKYFAFTDSSIIVFTKDSTLIPKHFNSTIKVEQIIDKSFRDSLSKRFKNLNIRLFSDELYKK